MSPCQSSTFRPQRARFSPTTTAWRKPRLGPQDVAGAMTTTTFMNASSYPLPCRHVRLRELVGHRHERRRRHPERPRDRVEGVHRDRHVTRLEARVAEDGSEAEAPAHVRRIDLAELALGADDAAEDGGVGHDRLAAARIRSPTIRDAGRP